MRNSNERNLFLAAAVIAALWLQACSDDKPANAEAQQTEGSEADNPIDEAHQNFKREVDPAADVVDDKTKAVVNEGKRAVKKTVNAIDGDDDVDEAADEKAEGGPEQTGTPEPAK